MIGMLTIYIMKKRMNSSSIGDKTGKEQIVFTGNIYFIMQENTIDLLM
jgi:hypothetical protein